MIHLCWPPLYHAYTADVTSQESQLTSGEYSKTTVNSLCKGSTICWASCYLGALLCRVQLQRRTDTLDLEAEPDSSCQTSL